VQTLRAKPRSRSPVPVILHGLLFLVIAAAVLTYWQASEYALNGNWLIEYYKSLTYIDLVPAWQKAAKDGFSLLLLFGSLAFSPSNPNPALKNNQDLWLSYLICAIALIIAFIRSLYTNLPNLLIFSSLRPFLSVIAVFIFCHRHLHAHYLRWVFEGTNILALIQVYFAIRQRNAAVVGNGVSWFDSGSARSIGTFIEPNTVGLFLALVFYLNLSILPPHRLRPLLLGAIGLGIFLTGSRAAQLSSLIVLSFTCYQKFGSSKNSIVEYFFKAFFALPLLFGAALMFYERINIASGRSANSSASGGRLEILLGNFAEGDTVSLFFGKYLSYGSNIVQTLTNSYAASGASREFFLADSTPAWLIGQFGVLGVLGVMGVVYAFWRSQSSSSRSIDIAQNFPPVKAQLRTDRIGLLIYLFFSTSTIILFEFYAVLPLIITLIFMWQVRKNIEGKIHCK
jgi:hypothetical protein